MKKGITVAGNIFIDQNNYVDSYPNEGLLENIKETIITLGGCVSNTATNLAFLDKSIPIYASGIIGNDEYGKLILKEFQKRKINIEGVKITQKKQTGIVSTFISKKTDTRTFFVNEGANAILGEREIVLLPTKIFHIGYLLLLRYLDSHHETHETQMAYLLDKIQQEGIKTSIDVVSENSDRYQKIIIPSLKYTNYVIINDIELSKITKINIRDKDGKIVKKNVFEAMKKMFDYGVNEIVAIHTPEAGFIMNNKNEFKYMPSLELPRGYIKNSAGAGDGYCSGVLYGLYNNLDLEEILKIASLVATSVLGNYETCLTTKNLNEIMELEKRYNRKENVCL